MNYKSLDCGRKHIDTERTFSLSSNSATPPKTKNCKAKRKKLFNLKSTATVKKLRNLKKLLDPSFFSCTTVRLSLPLAERLHRLWPLAISDPYDNTEGLPTQRMQYVPQVGHFEITFCDALVVQNVLVMSLKEKKGGNDVICQRVKLGYF